MSEPQFLYLTSTGHRTGKPHEIEIWFVAYGGRYYLISERRERSHWVQNIRRNPAITFRVGEQTFSGSGRVVDPASEPELTRAVSSLMDSKYGWSDGLLVELAPSGWDDALTLD